MADASPMGNRPNPLDGALDHIAAQGMELDAAKLALHEIRQTVAPYLGFAGPAGYLAGLVLGLVDAAPQYKVPEPQEASHG